MHFLFKEKDKLTPNGPQLCSPFLYRSMLRLCPTSVRVTLQRAAWLMGVWLLEWVFDQQEIIRHHGRFTQHGVPLSFSDEIKNTSVAHSHQLRPHSSDTSKCSNQEKAPSTRVKLYSRVITFKFQIHFLHYHSKVWGQ